MGDFHPDAGEADHKGAGNQMENGGVFWQVFKIVGQLFYEGIKDVQRMWSMGADPFAIISILIHRFKKLSDKPSDDFQQQN